MSARERVVQLLADEGAAVVQRFVATHGRSVPEERLEPIRFQLHDAFQEAAEAISDGDVERFAEMSDEQIRAVYGVCAEVMLTLSVEVARASAKEAK